MYIYTLHRLYTITIYNLMSKMNKQSEINAFSGKKPYDSPTIEQVALTNENIICASGIQTEPYEDGEFNW